MVTIGVGGISGISRMTLDLNPEPKPPVSLCGP